MWTAYIGVDLGGLDWVAAPPPPFNPILGHALGNQTNHFIDSPLVSATHFQNPASVVQ